MAKSGATFTSTLSSKWVGKTERQLDTAVLAMITDVDTRAKILAPRASNALVNSSRIERVREGFYRVIFGSSRVPYARRRHFENKKNPQTLGYLKKAGDSVARGNLDKYIRK